MRIERLAIVFLLFAALPGFCQTEAKLPPAADGLQIEASTPDSKIDESSSRQEPASAVSNGGSDEMQMQVPAPVSTGGYSMEFASETPRSNYLGGGLTYTTTYNDDINQVAGKPIKDVGYSIAPAFYWRQSSSRVLWDLSYAPGFTFYHHNSFLDQFDQNVSFDSQFRLSPHVKLTLREALVRTSNPLNQLTTEPNSSGGLVEPVATVVSPVTDQMANSASAQLTYQFGLNSTIGANGLFYDLHYLNPSEVPGLSNSHSKAFEGFYLFRIARRHYLGTKYQFQTLLSGPNDRTETQANLLSYTIYLQSNTSLSFYAGPQYAYSHGPTVALIRRWVPAYGTGIGWQGRVASFALSAGRSINAGGGLQGAVRADTASASIRGQFAKTWSAGVSAYYDNNHLLAPQPNGSKGGHSISGSISLHHQIRESLGLELSYTRLHQSYSGISAVPNANRVALSLSYKFLRPIGR